MEKKVRNNGRGERTYRLDNEERSRMGKKAALEAILGKEFSTKILKEYIMKILF